jgi:hypothetical protein
MFFAKNEIIELENKNYLVLNSAIVDNEIYYKVCEVNVEENSVDSKEIYIQAIKEYGTLYIEEVKDKNIIEELDKIMKS